MLITRLQMICQWPLVLKQARIMGTLTILFVVSVLLFSYAAAKKPKKCYKPGGCCLKAEGCNLVIPSILNNSQAEYENCTSCKPYCSEPEEKPLLLHVEFDIIGMKYLPKAGGPFSSYQISME